MPTDYPDGFRRNLPGHTVDMEAGFSLPWCESTSLVIAAAGNSSFTVEFSSLDWIYFVDMINVTPQAYTEFYISVAVNGVLYTAGANMGFIIIPLRTNPSINFINGDSVAVTVTNKDSSSRTFKVMINGSKILRPSTYGKVPGALFTPDSYAIALGSSVQFTDASAYDPTSWEWDFDDGTEHSTEQHPSHVYSAEGSYNPSLKAVNSYGYDTYVLATAIVVSSYVDLATYTEVDPGSKITVTSLKANAVALVNNVASYVYKDYGVGHFTTISHRFATRLVAVSSDNPAIFVYGLSNSVAPMYIGVGKKIAVYWARAGVAYNLCLRCYDGSSIITTDSTVLALGVTYYIEVLHTAGTTVFTVKVYSDSAYSVLVDTLTIDSSYANTTWRYHYCLSSAGAGTADTMSAYVENVRVS